jgi:Putative addiction module component
MSHNFEEVPAEALSLDRESKVQLAERLAIDLANHDEHLTAWVQESKRRYEMIKRGEMGTVDAREAIENIRKSLFSK